MSSRIEEIEARIAARKEKHEAGKLAQYEQDLEALDQLEAAYGYGKVARVNLNTWVDGFPTFVVVRAPKPIEFKRYQDQLADPKKHASAAASALADVCVVYPEKDIWKSLCDELPAVRVMSGVAAVELSAAKAHAEGKG
jgi:hypothetical protein